MEQAKKSFLKNVVGFSMVTWISFAIGLIASPIGTRLFLPEEWGKINLFNTNAALFSSFCYLGLDQAFVRFFREPPGRQSRAGMFTFCLATSIGFSILSSLLLMIGWQGISTSVVGQPDFSVFLCLCLFSMCCVLFRYLSLCYRMEQNAKLYTIQGVLYVLITKIAYLSVGFVSPLGRNAILFLTLLTGLLCAAFVFIQRGRFDPRFLSQIDRPFLQGMTRYAAPLIPIALITVLNSSVSNLVLGRLEGFGSVGIYSSALVMANTVNIIQTGFNAYWAPYVYENYQTDNKRRFFTVHRLMACLLTLFGLGVTLLQTPVFLLLGEKFRGSVVFFPFLFLAPICYCLSETTGMGIGIAKKTHWNSIVFLTSVLVNLGLCLLLIPIMGATGAAIASALAAIASLIFRTYAGEKYYKAIFSYRYVAYTIGLLLLAAVSNLILNDQPVPKFSLLGLIFALALFLFRGEIKILFTTVLQLLKEGKGALRRRAGGDNQ